MQEAPVEGPAVQVRRLKVWLLKELQEVLPMSRRQADHKQGYDAYLGQLQHLNTREQVLQEVWEELFGKGGSEDFKGFNPGDFLGAEDSRDPRRLLVEDELADL